MIDLTRKMAQALAEGGRPFDYGPVEAWNARYGPDTIAAMEAAGLIRRQQHWTGCLELTELGERGGRVLYGRDYAAVGHGAGRVYESDLVGPEQWDQLRQQATAELAR